MSLIVLHECCIFYREIWCFNQQQTYVAAGFHLIFRWMIISTFNIFVMMQTLIFNVADGAFRCCRSKSDGRPLPCSATCRQAARVCPPLIHPPTSRGRSAPPLIHLPTTPVATAVGRAGTRGASTAAADAQAGSSCLLLFWGFFVFWCWNCCINRCCNKFLVYCNRSPSWCNRFSFMLQSLWTYYIRVLDMLRVLHVNIWKLDLNIFVVANIIFRCCGCWVLMMQTRDVGCCKY
jgi:hypothetical protein